MAVAHPSLRARARHDRFHWHWLLGQDWLPDFAGELRDVVHQLRAGTRELAPSIRVGKCPTVVEMLEPDDPDAEPIPVTCGASLRLRLGDDVIRCRERGTTWPRRRWHLLGDGWAGYATLSADFGVPVSTLSRWCHEDGWTERGEGGRRRWARAEAVVSYARRRGELDPVTRQTVTQAAAAGSRYLDRSHPQT